MKDLRNFGFDTNKKRYVIAEIGINHGGSLETSKKLIDSASKTGCDAVKFQTYITEKRAPKGNKEIFDILKSCELPFKDFKTIKDYCEDKKITFFSTPFDEESIDYLESINCPFYKIASFDTVNKKLLQKLADTKKPIIMSVGMSSLKEIREAYGIFRNNKISILHCISSYPTEEKDANLDCMQTLKETFNCIIGHSDHTKEIKVPLYAAAMGAQIIEKHYMIDEKMECIDSPVSITQKQMTNLVNELENLDIIQGKTKFGVRDSEKGTVIFRRFSK